MARYARELHDGADESEDEVVMDEAPSQIISTCSNFIQEYVSFLCVKGTVWTLTIMNHTDDVLIIIVRLLSAIFRTAIYLIALLIQYTSTYNKLLCYFSLQTI